jgi:type I restriction-modification system DNA methylase subunit
MKTLKEIKQHLLSYDISVDIDNRNNFGEVFTPTDLVEQQLSYIDFTNAADTCIDHGCGNGQMLSIILLKKLENGIEFETALATIYGVDIQESNVLACRERLLCGREDLRHIMERNIVCHDALTYDYSFNGTNKNNDELVFDSLFE